MIWKMGGVNDNLMDMKGLTVHTLFTKLLS